MVLARYIVIIAIGRMRLACIVMDKFIPKVSSRKGENDHGKSIRTY